MGRNLGLILALLALFAVGAITAGDRFTNIDNILVILRLASIIGVISIGMTFVIIGGGIDLSVGSVMGLASVVATLSAVQAAAENSTWLVMVFVALAVGLTRNPSPAAIVGYSGALATLEALPAPGKGPAILLVHGDMDQVIPVEALYMAREMLGQAGLPVEWHVSQGIGHGIDNDGLRLGGAFLRQAFANVTSPAP